MTYALYFHPLSSYSQKAITAFYEKGIRFEPRLLDGGAISEEFARLWPVGHFPVLVDGDRFIFEATGIIEYIDVAHPSPRLIPADPYQAVDVRMWDRFFDNYINTPQQRLVFAAIGREPDGNGAVLRKSLETAYGILDERMNGREWVAGDSFSLADCAAAPALLYADWTHAIAQSLKHLRAYRSRLLSRPAYARALDEARPYRHLFPLGAPSDRD